MCLQDSDLGDPGAILLAEAITKVSAVRNVNLGKNRITDVGAIKLAEALEKQAALFALCLSFNKIGDAGARRLSLLLDKQPQLKVMSLDSNCIGDSGAWRLIAALSNNERPGTTCSLTNNPVKQLDCNALENLQASAATTRALCLRSVTLGQLLKLYADGRAAEKIVPESSTTSDVVFGMVLPDTKETGLSYSEAKGPANPPPKFHVIHAWGARFRDLLTTLASHVSGKANPSLELTDPQWIFEPKQLERPYFIDAFCANQHMSIKSPLRAYGISDDSTLEMGQSGCQIDKFPLVAEQIQRRGGTVMMVVDADYLIATRVLCLREMHCALRDELKVDVLFSRLRPFPAEKRNKLVQHAKATFEKDKDKFLEELAEMPGGQDRFNKTIMEFLDVQIEATYQATIMKMSP